MPRTRKPYVNTSPIAHLYSMPNERIVEFTASDGKGGLISIVHRDDDTVAVSVYALSSGVSVTVDANRTPAAH